jgi:hypothetical protein
MRILGFDSPEGKCQQATNKFLFPGAKHFKARSPTRNIFVSLNQLHK